MTYVFGALVNLLIAAVAAGYMRHSIRSRAVVGLFWDFLRDEEPIRFWAYLGLVSLVVLDQLFEAGEKLASALL